MNIYIKTQKKIKSDNLYALFFFMRSLLILNFSLQ